MTTLPQTPKIILGITGASGMLFLTSFLDGLAGMDVIVHGICSTSGRDVLELERQMAPEKLVGVSRWFRHDDFSASPASGSSDYSSMVVLPCSMGTLAAIAGGLSINLIHRAADVMLKERKRLVLAVRETPLNRVHLKNMLMAHDAGAVICPTMPSYYFKTATLEQAVRSYAWRLADQLCLHMPGRKRWDD